jgi:hypothetical protein
MSETFPDTILEVSISWRAACRALRFQSLESGKARMIREISSQWLFALLKKRGPPQ